MAAGRNGSELTRVNDTSSDPRGSLLIFSPVLQETKSETLEKQRNWIQQDIQ